MGEKTDFTLMGLFIYNITQSNYCDPTMNSSVLWNSLYQHVDTHACIKNVQPFGRLTTAPRIYAPTRMRPVHRERDSIVDVQPLRTAIYHAAPEKIEQSYSEKVTKHTRVFLSRQKPTAVYGAVSRCPFLETGGRENVPGEHSATTLNKAVVSA